MIWTKKLIACKLAKTVLNSFPKWILKVYKTIKYGSKAYQSINFINQFLIFSRTYLKLSNVLVNSLMIYKVSFDSLSFFLKYHQFLSIQR